MSQMSHFLPPKKLTLPFPFYGGLIFLGALFGSFGSSCSSSVSGIIVLFSRKENIYRGKREEHTPHPDPGVLHRHRAKGGALDLGLLRCGQPDSGTLTACCVRGVFFL
jgi:hypothetical protein